MLWPEELELTVLEADGTEFVEKDEDVAHELIPAMVHPPQHIAMDLMDNKEPPDQTSPPEAPRPLVAWLQGKQRRALCPRRVSALASEATSAWGGP